MTIKDLKEKIDGVPDDVEINIVNSIPDDDYINNPERNYNIDKIVFDTVDQLFIEIS